MALLVQAARHSQSTIRDRYSSHRPPTRGGVKAARLKACPKPKNRGEKTVARALSDAGIAYAYEPHVFQTDRSGKRRGALRPDFYLPALDLYLEVTQGDDYKLAFLSAKIADAERENEVHVMLIGRREVEALYRGQLEIASLIRKLQSSFERCRGSAAA